jgi:hypothetical protein
MRGYASEVPRPILAGGVLPLRLNGFCCTVGECQFARLRLPHCFLSHHVTYVFVYTPCHSAACAAGLDKPKGLVTCVICRSVCPSAELRIGLTTAPKPAPSSSASSSAQAALDVAAAPAAPLPAGFLGYAVTPSALLRLGGMYSSKVKAIAECILELNRCVPWCNEIVPYFACSVCIAHPFRRVAFKAGCAYVRLYYGLRVMQGRPQRQVNRIQPVGGDAYDR